MYKRPTYHTLLSRLQEQRRFIQVLAGPRQTGKTTITRQIMDTIVIPAHYVSADEPLLKDTTWIEQQWQTARLKLAGSKMEKGVLILDEIQKIPHWSETVKRLWDHDSNETLSLHVILLGSSPLLVGQGLSESLAGRFELLPVMHWSFYEMKEAFGVTIDEYIFYGGYPGSAPLIQDPLRWRRYIMDSLVETTISRDILLMTRVDKPALLRRLFELGCLYSGQMLSYQKILGQLHDAGNTTTLAHYLELLGGAGLLSGLPKYAGQHFRKRASSPKLLCMNSALMAALEGKDMQEVMDNPTLWGRFVETAIGAHLANSVKGTDIDLYYWAGKNLEVDYVLVKNDRIVAIEVKSHRKKTALPGMAEFSRQFHVEKKLLVGGDGMDIEVFLKLPVSELFE
ncbi:ATP-binding protein [candidate division KSB1 bacterium]|nr:ATP-binding protein [candidate division KSB1 bacterium]